MEKLFRKPLRVLYEPHIVREIYTLLHFQQLYDYLLDI
jgi:hypothetical protein